MQISNIVDNIRIQSPFIFFQLFYLFVQCIVLFDNGIIIETSSKDVEFLHLIDFDVEVPWCEENKFEESLRSFCNAHILSLRFAIASGLVIDSGNVGFRPFRIRNTGFIDTDEALFAFL